eukprot:TRINITY_DN12864_c0_g1_i1.p1 TRINITY_DN12864_c0_g1~~TRINITY_DN12864_c0_g1_i1.p1  ORF type:complete len:730 (+),score=141.07 TRINITY_DN12864_c0_g1_i1:186-2375(+)
MDTQVEILDHSKSTKRDEVNSFVNGESKNTKKSSKTTTKKRNTKKSDAETTDNGNSEHSQTTTTSSSKKRKGSTVENHVVKKQKTKNGNDHSVNDSGDDDVITNGDSNAPSSPRVSEREAASEIDESSTVSVNEKKKSTSKAKSSSKQAENHRILDESSNMTNHTDDEEAIDIEGTDPPVKTSSKKKKPATTSSSKKKSTTTAKSSSTSSKKKKPTSSKTKNEEERIDIDEVSRSETDHHSSPLKEEPKHNDKATNHVKEEHSVNGKDESDAKSERDDKSDIIEVKQNDEPITVDEVEADVKVADEDSSKRIVLNDGSTDDNSNVPDAKNSDDDIALMEIDDPETTNHNSTNHVDEKGSTIDDIKSNTDSNNHVITVPVVSDLKNKNKKKYTTKTKTKKASTKKNSKSGGRNSDEHKSEGSSPERIEQKQQELEKLKKYKEAMHNFNDQAKANPFCVTVLSVFVEVMDELCLEICQEVHRKIKTGNFCINCDGNGDSKVESGDGEKRMKDKIPFVKCDAGCGRTVAATRYAPHLEKCLGLGKSRNRRRPVALEVGVPTKPIQYFDDEELDDGQDGNYDGFGTPDPKKNKLKVPSKSNNKTVSSSPPAPVSVKSTDLPLNTNPKKPLPKMKQMNIQAYMDSLRRKPRGHLEKILKTKCGVISVKTGKMCTKSLRCPQHNDEMRAQIRSVLLDPDFATGSEVNSSDMDMMDITNENSNDNDDADDVEFTDD